MTDIPSVSLALCGVRVSLKMGRGMWTVVRER